MLKIGDKVEVLDDVLSGTITAINGNTVTIETDEGFDLDFNANELVKTGSKSINQDAFKLASINEILSEKTEKPDLH